MAIVSFLQAGVVEQHHWLTGQQFLDRVAIGLMAPGPVVIAATFNRVPGRRVVGALVATVAGTRFCIRIPLTADVPAGPLPSAPPLASAAGLPCVLPLFVAIRRPQLKVRASDLPLYLDRAFSDS